MLRRNYRRSRVYEFLQRFRSEIPRRLWIIVFVVPTSGVCLGLLYSPDPGVETTRTLLSTLAGGQAAILAIVFSVSVIGMQLVGQRYSSRLISMFVDSPIFLFTFALFLGSMGLDVGLLFLQPNSPSTIYVAVVVGAVGMATVSVLSLYFFVGGAVRMSTPEGVIDSFSATTTTDGFLHSVRDSTADSSERAHPLRPLYTLIMNTVTRGEHVAAVRGLDEYAQLTETTIEELDERQIFDEAEAEDEMFENEDKNVVRGLFSPVCEEHLKEIPLHAANHEEYGITKTATETQLKIGKRGLELPTDTVSRQAQSGLSRTILESSVDSETNIANYHAWEKQSKLLVKATESPRPSVVWSISSSIRSDIERQLRDVNDAIRHRRAMTELFGGLERAHGELLTHYSEDVARVEMDWQREFVPDDAPNGEAVEAVHRLRSTLIDATEWFLRVAIEHGQYPATAGNFRGNWRQICIDASESEADDYAISLCQVLIELAFIDHMELEEGLDWYKIIAEVRENGDSEIVDAAFERFGEYEEVSPNSVVRIGNVEVDLDDTHYPNSLAIDGYQPLNARIGFEDTIDAIQNMVENDE